MLRLTLTISLCLLCSCNRVSVEVLDRSTSFSQTGESSYWKQITDKNKLGVIHFYDPATGEENSSIDVSRKPDYIRFSHELERNKDYKSSVGFNLNRKNKSAGFSYKLEF